MHTKKIPKHIAFIMDGNRRWAKQKLMPQIIGHTEGSKTLKKIAKAVKLRGILHMTVYALSTENLKRTEKELKHLFSLIGSIEKDFEDIIQEDVRIRIIGNTSLLPESLATSLQKLEEKTCSHTSLTLTLAIAYGGRDEIIRGVHKAIEEGTNVDESSFQTLLDTGDMPDVDLIVRTGGHQRLSNFLLWSSAYAELYFTDTLWPAFDEAELDTILAWFDEQQRNHGK